MNTRFAFLSLILITLAALRSTAAEPNTLTGAEKAAGWTLLFDGKSLDGWRASDAPGTFSVKAGALVVRGPRSHLYYVGPIANRVWQNFEFSAEILTFPKANSGVYFHTEWQEKGWPDKGFEVQVNNSHKDPKRTAGLYNVKENYDAVAKDGVWFTLKIKVTGKHIVTSVNDKVTIDYIEPDDWTPPPKHVGRFISRGTFALQGHDPESEVHFRSIKVRRLP